MSGKRRKPSALEQSMLEDLTAGDLLYGFLLSARSSSRMMRLARQRAVVRYRRKKALQGLIKRGYVTKKDERVSLTPRGEGFVNQSAGKVRSSLSSNKWDGKWRIVAFDIPEKYAPMRRVVRRLLKDAGFLKLQQSIWVFPHECEPFVQLLKSESHVAPYVLYGVLERIEHAERLKRAFRMK